MTPKEQDAVTIVPETLLKPEETEEPFTFITEVADHKS